MKRLISAMLATAIATLLGVLLAPAASAHSNGISGTAACLPDGTQTVTWTISNDYKSAVYVTQTNPSGVGTLTGLPATIAARTGSALTTVVVEQSGIPGTVTSVTLQIKGVWAVDGYSKALSSKPLSLPGCKPAPVAVKAAAPTVTQSSACDIPGSYTVPAVTGVSYQLNGRPIRPGTYSGAATGTLTAVALDGYVLTGVSSFPIAVDKAATCPVAVTAVAPTVTPSSACDVPGSYTVPAVTGVTYQLDGRPIKPGTYTGALSGTITATAVDGYVLQGAGTFPVTVTPAATCPVVVTAVAPTLTASSACDAPGSYTVPAVTGVTYLLGGQPLTAGTHTGSFTGILTAVADAGYVLTGRGSFPVTVDPAAVCPAVVPDVVPQTPTVPPVVTTPTGLSPSVGVSAAYLEAPAGVEVAVQPQAPQLAATGSSGALPMGMLGAMLLLLGGSLVLLRRRLS